MKHGVVFFILLSVSVISCQRHRQERLAILDNSESILLSADSLSISNDLLSPRKVFVLGDRMAVFEPKDVEGFLHLYDKEGSFICKYGIVGNAKNEYISPNIFANGKSLIVLSMNGTYSEIESSGDQLLIGETQTIEDKSLSMGLNFLALGAGGYSIIESASSHHMLVFSGPDGKIVEYDNYPTDIPESIDAFYKKEVISSCSYAISDKLDTLFQAFKYYPSVGVISVRDRHWDSTVLPFRNVNEYKIKDGIPYYEDPILYYTYAASSGDYFYALFQNGTKTSISSGGRSEIHVFSHDGILIKRYVLDRRIYHFAVNQDDTAIYALGLNKELLAELYVYHL